MPRRPEPRPFINDVSWPINHLRVQMDKDASGLWLLRIAGLVNGEFRAHDLYAPTGELAEGAQRAVHLFETVHQNTKEPL